MIAADVSEPFTTPGRNGRIVPPEDRSLPQDEADEYFCPVCGSELSLSNFLTPERDYYCPYCATRQTPAVV